jgi:Rrf2 family transcriptional regulator, cysteine metabolism repressor
VIITTKCQYALRAVYEVARSDPGTVMTIGGIAKAQRVPQRYLEGILNQLRKGGVLEAQRGRSGGYRLARAANRITVGDVVRLIDGPIRAVACVQEGKATECPLRQDCVFLPTWQRVQETIDQTLDSTTFADLLKLERDAKRKEAPSYTI